MCSGETKSSATLMEERMLYTWMRAARGDEDGFALALHEAVAKHALLLPQTLPQPRAQVDVCIVDGVADELPRPLLGSRLLRRNAP